LDIEYSCLTQQRELLDASQAIGQKEKEQARDQGGETSRIKGETAAGPEALGG